jgi:hypothetical protein
VPGRGRITVIQSTVARANTDNPHPFFVIDAIAMVLLVWGPAVTNQLRNSSGTARQH